MSRREYDDEMSDLARMAHAGPAGRVEDLDSSDSDDDDESTIESSSGSEASTVDIDAEDFKIAAERAKKALDEPPAAASLLPFAD